MDLEDTRLPLQARKKFSDNPKMCCMQCTSPKLWGFEEFVAAPSVGRVIGLSLMFDQGQRVGCILLVSSHSWL